MLTRKLWSQKLYILPRSIYLEQIKLWFALLIFTGNQCSVVKFRNNHNRLYFVEECYRLAFQIPLQKQRLFGKCQPKSILCLDFLIGLNKLVQDQYIAMI